MGCFLPIIAFLCPRLTIVFIVILTNWFSASFDTVIWPLLGFVFMPYSVLAYMAAMLNHDHHLSGGWLALFVLASFLDLMNLGLIVGEDQGV